MNRMRHDAWADCESCLPALLGDPTSKELSILALGQPHKLHFGPALFADHPHIHPPTTAGATLRRVDDLRVRAEPLVVACPRVVHWLLHRRNNPPTLAAGCRADCGGECGRVREGLVRCSARQGVVTGLVAGTWSFMQNRLPQFFDLGIVCLARVLRVEGDVVGVAGVGREGIGQLHRPTLGHGVAVEAYGPHGEPGHP